MLVNRNMCSTRSFERTIAQDTIVGTWLVFIIIHQTRTTGPFCATFDDALCFFITSLLRALYRHRHHITCIKLHTLATSPRPSITEPYTTRSYLHGQRPSRHIPGNPVVFLRYAALPTLIFALWTGDNTFSLYLLLHKQ